MFRMPMLANVSALALFAAAGKAGSAPVAPAPAPAPAPAAIPPVAPAPAPAPAPSPIATTAVTEGKGKREEPVIGAITSGFKIPERKKPGIKFGGGAKKYPFDDLANIGDSFPLLNKTAKQMTGTISSANDRFYMPVKDTAGNPVMVDEPILDDAGKPVIVNGAPITKSVAKHEQTRMFAVYDTEGMPDTVPGEKCRVFRIAPTERVTRPRKAKATA